MTATATETTATTDPATDPVYVEVDAEGGALIHGTTKGNAEEYAAVKAIGAKWSRNVGAWWLPRTLTTTTRDAKVHQFVALMAEAGRTVRVEQPEEQLSVAERREARAERTGQTLSQNPVTVANRIEKNEASLRDVERSLSGEMTPHARRSVAYGGTAPKPAEGEHRERLLARAQELHEAINLDKATLARLQAAGIVVDYSQAGIKPGDLIHYWSGWRKVVRVNAKSVTAETEYSWTETVKWQDIKGHRPAGEQAEPVTL